MNLHFIDLTAYDDMGYLRDKALIEVAFEFYPPDSPVIDDVHLIRSPDGWVVIKAHGREGHVVADRVAEARQFLEAAEVVKLEADAVRLART